MKKGLWTLVLLSLYLPLWAQEDAWILSGSIDFPRLEHVSIDNQEFIFVADREGNLYQFSPEGRQLNNFSPPRQARLSQLEAFWTVNVFTFSNDLQEFRILDRFLNPVSENKFSGPRINLVKAATLGNNNVLWLFDETDLSLKLWDYRRNVLIQEQPLNLVLSQSEFYVTDIREYQNMLFLQVADEGVYIFDNQANYLKTLPAISDQKLSFWKNYLLYTQSGELIIMDIPTGQTARVPLPKEKGIQGVFAQGSKVYLQTDRKILIYDLGNSPLKNF